MVGELEDCWGRRQFVNLVDGDRQPLKAVTKERLVKTQLAKKT
jgi:hypothetical protein